MHVYGLNIVTGRVKKAELMPLDRTEGELTFRLIEEKNYLYLPAKSIEYAEREFDVMLKKVKSGVIKLTWREKIAKWWLIISKWLKSLLNGVRN